MKVNFADCEFGCFEPHYEIDFKGKKYRAVDVDVTLEDGTKETHTIADYTLEEALVKEMGGYDLEGTFDDDISYYCSLNDGIYFCLENITGEEITEVNGKKRDKGFYYIVLEEYNYLNGVDERNVCEIWDSREDAIAEASDLATAVSEYDFFKYTGLDPLPLNHIEKEGSVVDGFIITPKNGLDNFYYSVKVIEVRKSH